MWKMSLGSQSLESSWSVPPAVALFSYYSASEDFSISWQNMAISCFVGEGIISPGHLFLVEHPIPSSLWCWPHVILLERNSIQGKNKPTEATFSC